MPHLAAPAGLFISAEWHRRVENVVAVDPHRTRAKMSRRAVGFADIPPPNGSSQAIFAIVGTRQNFLRIVERHRGNDRPEDFLLHHLHVFTGIHKDGGLHEITLVPLLMPACHGSRTFRKASLQISPPPLYLFLCADRPHSRLPTHTR